MIATTRVLTEGRLIKDVIADRNTALEAENATNGDRLGYDRCRDEDNLRPWPSTYRWIACYAVRGGSEGYYVHIDAVMVGDENYIYRRSELLVFGKFWDWDTALTIARACTLMLDI